MEDSAADKIQKSIVIFIKWFLVLALVLAFIGGAVFLYQHSGIKEYRADLAYLNRLGGEERTQTIDYFFGKRETRNLFGGVLAGTWKYGIWVWGKPGLSYFPVNNNTQYMIVTGCTNANIINSGTLESSSFKDIASWAEKALPGNYLTVSVSGGNKVDSVVSFTDFSTSVTPWVFCDKMK